MAEIPTKPMAQGWTTARYCRAITAHDTNDIPTQLGASVVDAGHYPHRLTVGGAGDLVMILEGDTASVTVPVVAGQEINARVKQVLATGTTATGLFAWWF